MKLGSLVTVFEIQHFRLDLYLVFRSKNRPYVKVSSDTKKNDHHILSKCLTVNKENKCTSLVLCFFYDNFFHSFVRSTTLIEASHESIQTSRIPRSLKK